MTDTSCKKIPAVLEKLDFNINMFSKYTGTHAESNLEDLKGQRQEIELFQKGEITFDQLSYRAREWFFEMPSWGTYGT
jgi:hypothetical protein